MEASYAVALMHQQTGETLDIPSTNYRAMEYTKRVNGVGWFELTLPGTYSLGLETEYLDWRVVIWRQPHGKKEYVDFAGFVRDIYLQGRGGTDLMVLSGPDYNDMLRRRVIAYKAGTSEAKKSATAADDVMKELVSENLGSDATDTDRDYSSYMSIQADATAGTSLSKSCSFAGLIETLQAIAKSSLSTPSTAVYFGVEPLGDGYDMEFRTKIGQWGQDHRHPDGDDGPVVFARGMGNMGDYDFNLKRSDEINYVYAAGIGEAENRTLTSVSDSDRIAESIINRREGFFDGMNYETTARLQSAARARLHSGEPERRNAFSPISIGNCEYGIHWAHGDRVTVKLRGRSYDMHIHTVTVSVTDDGGESIQARAGEWA